MSNLMINQLNGGVSITATTTASTAVIPVQLPATASVPNLTVPMSVAVLAGYVATSSGIGNMALQNATTVAIAGGTIDGTTIGGTVRGAGSFTTLFASGPLTATVANITGGTVTATGGSLTGYSSVQTQVLIATTVVVTGGTIVATGGSFTATGGVTAFNSTVPPTGGTAGFLMSNVANFGIFFGSGTPTTAAAQGSIYLRTDGTSTSTRLYVNSNGATAWAAVTTAS